MSMPTWINLSRAVRREMENTAKRGPRPHEVAMQKVADRNRRLHAKQEVELQVLVDAAMVSKEIV